MSNDRKLNSRGIKKSDLISSAAVTSLITFVLLTWSKNLSSNSALLPYINDQTISFMAGGFSFIITVFLSFLRYEINLIIYERDYTKKLDYCNRLIVNATTDEDKKHIEEVKSNLLKKAAKSISDEDY